MIGEALGAIVDSVRLWGERKGESVQARRDKTAAIREVMEAVIATKAYLSEVRDGADESRERERELSHRWQRAAMAISEYDHDLYTSAQLKALGYADPVEWKRAESRPWIVKLDNIIKQCEWLQSQTK